MGVVDCYRLVYYVAVAVAFTGTVRFVFGVLLHVVFCELFRRFFGALTGAQSPNSDTFEAPVVSDVDSTKIS